MSKERIVWRDGDVLHVVRLGTTSNKKIMNDPKEKMVQTYHFSRAQFEHANGTHAVMSKFFEEDSKANCIDCPLRKYGSCYTHKFTQARGFFSMLRSIGRTFENFEDLPKELTVDDTMKLRDMCKDRYIRFGTYGEPSLLSFGTISTMVSSAKSWTGYTHQWRNPHKQFLSAYFMASTHNLAQELQAARMGWRSFMAVGNLIDIGEGMVHCPASKEAGFKSSCDKCGLCSGTRGKGCKSVFIIEH